jgi:pyruvate/2-oxoglutarate dehydrogenase complex dihydrolipoamide acyltransferase (E2) component
VLAGCGCVLLAAIALGAVAVALLGAQGIRLPWVSSGSGSSRGVSGSVPGAGPDTDQASTSFGPVASGDPRRLGLPLPEAGEVRSESSLFHGTGSKPPADDFTFGETTAAQATPPAPPAPPPDKPEAGEDLAGRVAAARLRRDRAFERYTRLVTEGGEGNVAEALAEYRAAVAALEALERRSKARPR